MLDKIPAPARHAAIAFGAIFFGIFGKAIISAGGVTTLAWHVTFTSALDTACVGTVTIMLALYITPLTNQYTIWPNSGDPGTGA